MVSYIEPKFLNSKAYQTLTQTAAALKGLVGEGAKLYKGENEYDVDSFETALNILLQNAQKGMSIQRYKGLGEMNPEQLWETTMDPAVRRLLKVRIEDAIAADEVFVTHTSAQFTARWQTSGVTRWNCSFTSITGKRLKVCER